MSRQVLAALLLGWLLGGLSAMLIMSTILAARQRRNHIHEWSPWTEWVGFHDNEEIATWWKRERRCRTCGRVKEERAGRHDCFNKADKCPHYKTLAVTFDEKYAVKKMERDLGIDG